MTNTTASRLSQMDSVLDSGAVALSLAEELFAIVDLLESSASLLRVLATPGSGVDQRKGLVDQLLGSRVSAEALRLTKAATATVWPSTTALVDSLERQAVRCVLATAQSNDTLDTVEEELFRFSRLIDSHPELMASLVDRRIEVQHRQELVRGLVQNKVSEASLLLIVRSVKGRQRNVATTLEHYLDLAAQYQSRAVATVTVAKELTEYQHYRLAAILSKQLNRTVTLHVEVDPSILGGVRVQVGDEVIEGTVQDRLDQAHKLLNT